MAPPLEKRRESGETLRRFGAVSETAVTESLLAPQPVQREGDYEGLLSRSLRTGRTDWARVGVALGVYPEWCGKAVQGIRELHAARR